MKKIAIENLIPGTVTNAAIYTETGELLVTSGAVITEKHISIMKRRNIYDVYLKKEDDEEELASLLTKDFEKLDDLGLDDPLVTLIKKEQETVVRKKLNLPILQDLKNGQEGLSQLLQTSELAKKIDKIVDSGSLAEMPSGPALKAQSTQLRVCDRTDEYKTGVKTTYDQALLQVQYILDTLARGDELDGSIIRAIVDRFVKTWLTDRNILLNITHIKPSERDYLYHHSLNVCLLSINIAAAAGFSEKQIKEIAMGATLHDVGMLLVPQEIFLKKGRLSREEWFEVQKHSILGLHLLEKIVNLPPSIAFIAYQTHERENGQGYPKQRNGRFIHNYSKIVQVADVFESLSSPREYRPAYIPYQAMEFLVKMSAKHLLASEYVKAFISYMSLFPVGSMVELSNHYIAKVVQGNEFHFTKPIVSVVADSSGNLISKEKIYQIDLAQNHDLQIIKAVEWEKLAGIDLMQGF